MEMESKPHPPGEIAALPRSAEEQPAAAPHHGILREEVIAMRQIFGYTKYKDTTFTIPDLAAFLPGSEVKDVLLVAIDVDVPQNYDKKQIDLQLLHIGVSILDTRQLQELTRRSQQSSSPDNIIETHHFAIGPATKALKASKRLLLGEILTVPYHTEVRKHLEDLLADRNFVTIFHSTTLDLRVLQDLGIDLPTTRGAYVFDTNKVAQWPLQLSYRLSLEKLCSTLEVPFAVGHNAGNDAHSTLRAFLMLAVKDADRLQQIHGQGCVISEDLLKVMQQIAQAPIPGFVPRQPDDKAKQRQEAEEKLERKLKKKAREEVRKQLRREARTDAGNDNNADGHTAADDGAIRSALFEEKYQELVRFQQLPQAEKKQVRRQKREKWIVQQAEWAARQTNTSEGPSVSDSSTVTSGHFEFTEEGQSKLQATGLDMAAQLSYRVGNQSCRAYNLHPDSDTKVRLQV